MGTNCQHFECKEQIESRAPRGWAGDDTAPFNMRPLHNTKCSLVSSLRSGVALRVETSNFAALLRLSEELENPELLTSLLESS